MQMRQVGVPTTPGAMLQHRTLLRRSAARRNLRWAMLAQEQTLSIKVLIEGACLKSPHSPEVH